MRAWIAGRNAASASFARSGWTRLVSSTTVKSRSGSTHTEVPVNPRWPKDRGEKRLPDVEGGVGTVHPTAQPPSPSPPWRGRNSSTRAGGDRAPGAGGGRPPPAPARRPPPRRGGGKIRRPAGRPGAPGGRPAHPATRGRAGG